MSKQKPIPLQHNESYWLLDEALLRAIKKDLTGKCFSTYPDYERLKGALAHYAKVPKEFVFLSAGSDAAISTLAELCARDHMVAILPIPAFYGFERILSRHGVKTVYTEYTEHDGAFVFPLEKTIAELRPNRVLFLSNPNNPLGCALLENDLARLLAAAKKQRALVVLDEAYFEFCGDTRFSHIDSQPLIVLRTLSKAFGLSGARVGYALGRPQIIKRMVRLQLPWPVAHESVQAALTLFAHLPDVHRRRMALIRERGSFIRDLEGIEGVLPYPSLTNFVLARVPNAQMLTRKLAERGIYVAMPASTSALTSTRKFLRSCVRMSIPAPSDRQTVVSAIRECVERSH
ncbi:MAG: Histidinol-phosphate aminotransferase [Parcubacteria group bacterium GW2011_GWA2_51_10]|nr:MAG: Histidinol-phosphate aminotransferase [Parcubacteria group bacterium GW2011_GWA2_51_10]